MQTIWIDVEDLFDYARANPRPSGIQRVEFEICRCLVKAAGAGPVRFLRHTTGGAGFREVPWSAVETLFAGLSSTASAEEAAEGEMLATGTQAASIPESIVPPPPRRLRRRLLSWCARRVPERVRPALGNAVLLQVSALRQAVQAGQIAWEAMLQRREPVLLQQKPVALAEGGPQDAAPEWPDGFRDARPGDILLVLGSPWFHRRYAELVASAKREKGIRFGVLLYDIIPLRRPEFCDHSLVDLFSGWLGSTLPHADVVMAISQASADDIALYARQNGWKLLARPVAIPMGTGFGHPAPAVRLAGREYPEAGSYALIVSTIEARKNHLLLFRVWRRMLEEMPREKVPTLVFAGRVGWMVQDLMQQLKNADYLGGKLVLFQDPTDGELTTLYQGAQFTLFPSFYEGWGLPVTESLSFGKPCIISNTTSLPEAGGALARYFDPENTTEAYRVVREVVEDPEGLRNWQARVARDFRPVYWDDAAAAVLRAIEQPAEAPA